MAKVQKQFETFNGLIKLDWNDEEATLREKRDTVLDVLRKNLKKRFEEEKKPVPTFAPVNQGSYAMRTGVRPLDSDFDLDVGLLFNIKKDDHGPVEVKQWVHAALDGHTKRVEIRRPCVTVYYTKADEPVYHLDLAVYSDKGSNDDGKTYLAKGFPGSDEDKKVWYESDPEALVEVINNRHAGDDREQFRRVIRYLKRWKDHNFRSSGEAAPRGIALTAAAHQWFSPRSQLVDVFAGKREYDDLDATRCMVRSMLANFILQNHESEGASGERLKAMIPVPPWADPFDRMSNKQMAAFKAKLEGLRDAIDSATKEVDPHEACKTLKDQFGDDFPVPPKDETGKRGTVSIISSNSSA